MRKLTVGLGVAALSLILAGAALASFTQTSKVTLTAGKPAKPSGIKVDIHSTTSPGQQPKAATRLVLTFPAGTKFNLASVTPCTLSDAQITAGRTCPANSLIGTGSATASAYPLPQTIPASVSAYVAGGTKMLIVVKAPAPFSTTLIIHETTSGTKLNIPVPTPTVSGFKVVLVGLKLNVPARGSGRGALITAGRCTAGKFVVKSHFVYADGSTADVQSSSRCS